MCLHSQDSDSSCKTTAKAVGKVQIIQDSPTHFSHEEFKALMLKVEELVHVSLLCVGQGGVVVCGAG